MVDFLVYLVVRRRHLAVLFDNHNFIFAWLRNEDRLLLRFPAENEVLLIRYIRHLESIFEVVDPLDEALVLVMVLSLPESLHVNHLHFLVVREIVRQLLLYQVDYLELLGFAMEIRMDQVDVILRINYIVYQFI